MTLLVLLLLHPARLRVTLLQGLLLVLRRRHPASSLRRRSHGKRRCRTRKGEASCIMWLLLLLPLSLLRLLFPPPLHQRVHSSSGSWQHPHCTSSSPDNPTNT